VGRWIGWPESSAGEAGTTRSRGVVRVFGGVMRTVHFGRFSAEKRGNGGCLIQAGVA
jgi:hypothetical protein